MIRREEIKKIFKEINPDSNYSFQVESVSFAKYIADIAYNRAIDDAVKTCELVPAEWEFPAPLPSPANVALQCADRVRELKDHQRSE
jgi:hypothetical protein